MARTDRLDSPAVRALHADLVAVILSHVLSSGLTARDLSAYLANAAKGMAFNAAFAGDNRELLGDILRQEFDTARARLNG